MPRAPVVPNKNRNLLMGLVLGLGSAIGLILFLEYLDRSLRTEEDVQRHLSQPVLSVVPYTKTQQAKEKGADKSHSRHETFPHGLFLANYSPEFTLQRILRTLRDKLSFRHLEEELGSLLVTSAVALEGKTLTTANLAFAFPRPENRR